MSSASQALVLLMMFLHKCFASTGGDQPRHCHINHGMKFSYDLMSGDGPDLWPNMSNCCIGHWQSPINIITTECRCSQHHRIKYTLHPIGKVQGAMYNTGYAINMDFGSSFTPSLTGVPYWESSEYAFGSLHFHTGNMTGKGSEHYVDGGGFDGELHLVHYKKEYRNLDEAVLKPDGIAVVGLFLKESAIAPNKEMERLITSTQHTSSKGQKLLFDIDIRQLFPWNKDFYVYHGSLTTPPCSESVRWIVMKDPVLITKQSVNILRGARMRNGKSLGENGNCRPVASRSGRIVETNFNCGK